MSNKPWEIVNGRLLLRVRVTPNARANELGGLYEGGDGMTALAVRVTVPPEKGKANKALIALLAKALKKPKGALSVVSGETSRMKVLGIAPPVESAQERLLQILSEGEEQDS